MDDLTKEFLIESHDGLDCMENHLNDLRVGAENAPCVMEIFRALHTMKGTVGFLGFGRLELLAHAGEALLVKMRDGQIRVTEELKSLLMQLSDRLRLVLNLIETKGHEGKRDTDDDASILAKLNRACSGEAMHDLTAVDDNSAGRDSEAVDDRGGHSTATTVRVEIETLSRLMNLAGELVHTRNQFRHAAANANTFLEMGERLDDLSVRLRESVMQARMQPVSHLFQRFPRVAREVAASCGKKVKVEFRGGETGLDKSLLEAMRDPLTHAVRNAIDHGIELPQVRFLRGKSPEGRVELRAFHDGGQIVVEVRDDGAGIDCSEVLRRAVERDLITAERAALMSDEETMELLFQPGFSTRDGVTVISGRGVGMDVVRSNIEQAGGSVELQSVLGEGTVIRMRVPLTLAIIPALIARCGGEMFAVPHSTLKEAVLVHNRDEARVVRRIGNVKMLLLRDRLVPLIDLGDVLDVDVERKYGYYIAVIETKGSQFGLVVDDMQEPQDIVVKPLSGALADVGVYAGATILGDKRVALILDTTGLARRANLYDSGSVKADVVSFRERVADTHQTAKESGEMMLAFLNQKQQHVVIPLDCVERIERVEAKAIEQVAGEDVLQYRGDVVPLRDAFGNGRDDSEQCLVLICIPPQGERRFGLIVRDVLDVAQGQMLPCLSSTGERLVRVRGKMAALYPGFDREGRKGMFGAEIFEEAA